MVNNSDDTLSSVAFSLGREYERGLQMDKDTLDLQCYLNIKIPKDTKFKIKVFKPILHSKIGITCYSKFSLVKFAISKIDQNIKVEKGLLFYSLDRK